MLTRLRDKPARAELLRPGGYQLIVQEEDAARPRLGEGPWPLLDPCPGTCSAVWLAKVTAQRRRKAACGGASFTLGGLRVDPGDAALGRRAAGLSSAVPMDGSIGHDRLLLGALPGRGVLRPPVYQGATVVIGPALRQHRRLGRRRGPVHAG